MTEVLIFDASVAIKLLVPERDWAIARKLLVTHDITAPDLIFAECVNVLWKKVRKGELTRTEAVEAADKLTQLDITSVSLAELMSPATDLSAYLDHPAYDCFYLALAVLGDHRLVTEDERLVRVVRQKGPRSLSDLCVPLQAFA